MERQQILFLLHGNNMPCNKASLCEMFQLFSVSLISLSFISEHSSLYSHQTGRCLFISVALKSEGNPRNRYTKVDFLTCVSSLNISVYYMRFFLRLQSILWFSVEFELPDKRNYNTINAIHYISIITSGLLKKSSPPPTTFLPHLLYPFRRPASQRSLMYIISRENRH